MERFLSRITHLPSDAEHLVRAAHRIGFDKMLYSIDKLDGELDLPLQIVGSGLSAEYMRRLLERLREDPLRRMVARGEIPVTNMPISYENGGDYLSIARGKRFSVADVSLLKWCLSHGIRTGVSFRIAMPRGRCASLNFYSASSYSGDNLDHAIEKLFFVGHQVHAYLEPRLPKSHAAGLTTREVECLQWIALGKSNKEIADLLGLSADTVKEHVQRLFRKMNVSGRAQAVARGHAHEYLGQPTPHLGG